MFQYGNMSHFAVRYGGFSPWVFYSLKCNDGTVSEMASNKFKIQLLETTAALVTAAFGLVAALAWNEAIKAIIAEFLGSDGTLVGNLVYAIIVTIIAVIATLLVARALGKLKEADKEEQA